MVKVSYVNPTPDLKDRFTSQFTPVYKTRNSSLRYSGGLISPRRVNPVSTRSLLPEISALWKSLTTEEQNSWKAAGAAQSYTGYALFVQDTAYRIKFGIPGLATPSVIHAYKCGQITMSGEAEHFRLEQLHPVEYYRMAKVRGTKSQREPVAVIEQLLLPLQIGLSYRTNLTPIGDSPYAKFYAEVVRSYQSLDLVDTVGFEIPLSTDWDRQTATLTEVVGVARWYSLYIELHNVHGTLQFDLLESRHTGTNYAREFRCNNISSGFSNYNYQIPPSWAADGYEPGVTFGSVYPSDDWS